MTYGIIFVSALTALVFAIAVVEKDPPSEAVATHGWSQDSRAPITKHTAE
ncbi:MULTISPECIES: hypothetical protein [Rhizobium/Agrobacterium group]|nr:MULTISPECIES: hypothetical protein [Rhizobium/Agrobacterium group]TCR69278.1 hypothetical protein EV561_1416 [Rhizobium sp. BK376]